MLWAARLDQMGESIGEQFVDCFQDRGRRLDTETTLPRVTGRQTHRATARCASAEEYYGKNVAIPFF